MTKFSAIFDWDGVVIDSSSAHRISWEVLAKRKNLPFPDGIFKKTFGQTNKYVIPHVFKWASDEKEIDKIAEEKEALYREICALNGIDMIEGVREFLQKLKSAGISCAIGSSAPLRNLKMALDVLKLNEYFSAISSAEDVKQSKPAPDVFLIAAQKLGVNPQTCVVFEDSEHGIEAARSAGMKKVALATTHDEIFWAQKNTDKIIADFRELCLEDIDKLFE